MATALQNVTVTVTFNPANIGTPTGPISLSSNSPDFTLGNPTGDPPTQISVHPGICMIVFSLAPVEGSLIQPQFPTYPFVWFNQEGGSSIPQPDCYDVHWYNTNQCTVVDFNSALNTNPHVFNILVSYNNQTYGTDPVIVNEPPMG
jgi:hypothetical protein